MFSWFSEQLNFIMIMSGIAGIGALGSMYLEKRRKKK